MASESEPIPDGTPPPSPLHGTRPSQVPYAPSPVPNLSDYALYQNQQSLNQFNTGQYGYGNYNYGAGYGQAMGQPNMTSHMMGQQQLSSQQQQHYSMSPLPQRSVQYNPQQLMAQQMAGYNQQNYAANIPIAPQMAQYGGHVPNEQTLRYLEHQRMMQYYSEYYGRYYRDIMLRNQQQKQRNARMTPRKFSSFHSHVSFGPMNQLLTIAGSRIIIQTLDTSVFELLPESIRECCSCFPGPLTRDSARDGDGDGHNNTDPNDVLEWIKSREEHHLSYEIRQIIRVIIMLLKQNGHVTGADLSELLVDNLLSDNANPIPGNSNISNMDESIAGEVSIAERPVEQLKRQLLKGQRKSALHFATRSGLYDHAMALTYLLNPPPQPILPLIEIIRKFISTTLTRDEALHALYSRLLQTQTIQTVTPANQSSVIIHNLEQFAILIANDCHVEYVDTGYPHLVQLMVQLNSRNNQHLIYTEDDDSMLFINECLEFSRNLGTIYSLIPYKLLYAAKLFDYGLTSQALKYCSIIKKDQYRGDGLNWPIILRVIHMIESRCGHSDAVTDDAFMNNYNSNNNNNNNHELPDVTQLPNTTERRDSKDQINDMSVKHIETETDSVQQKMNALKMTENQMTENNHVNSGHYQTVDSNSASFINPVSVSQSQMPKKSNSWRRRNSSLSKSNNTNVNASQLAHPQVPQPQVPHPPVSPPAVPNQSQPQFNFFVPQIPLTDSVEEPMSFVSSGNFIPEMNPQSKGGDDYYDQTTNVNSILDKRTNVSSKVPEENGSATIKNDAPQQVKDGNLMGEQSGAKPGIFGGIFSRLVPRQKQAILPDDKSPSIVWDENTKQWIDKNADPSEQKQNQQIMNGPPKLPINLPNPSQPGVKGADIPPVSGQFQYVPSSAGVSKKTRYVDVLHNSKC